MNWATFWETLSQTHLVTLHRMQALGYRLWNLVALISSLIGCWKNVAFFVHNALSKLTTFSRKSTLQPMQKVTFSSLKLFCEK
jgi:hypothetical protein